MPKEVPYSVRFGNMVALLPAEHAVNDYVLLENVSRSFRELDEQSGRAVSRVLDAVRSTAMEAKPTVVVVGAGVGNALVELPSGFNVVGINKSPIKLSAVQKVDSLRASGIDVGIEEAQNIFRRIESMLRYVDLDQGRLPFEDNSVAVVVVSLQTFFYFQRPLDVLNEVWRVLAPGGTAIVNIPGMRHRFAVESNGRLSLDQEAIGLLNQLIKREDVFRIPQADFLEITKNGADNPFVFLEDASFRSNRKKGRVPTDYVTKLVIHDGPGHLPSDAFAEMDPQGGSHFIRTDFERVMEGRDIRDLVTKALVVFLEGSENFLGDDKDGVYLQIPELPVWALRISWERLASVGEMSFAVPSFELKQDPKGDLSRYVVTWGDGSIALVPRETVPDHASAQTIDPGERNPGGLDFRAADLALDEVSGNDRKGREALNSAMAEVYDGALSTDDMARRRRVLTELAPDAELFGQIRSCFFTLFQKTYRCKFELL